MPQITITVGEFFDKKNPGPVIEAEGYQGDSCKAATADLEKMLGEVKDREMKQTTPLQTQQRVEI